MRPLLHFSGLSEADYPLSILRKVSSSAAYSSLPGSSVSSSFRDRHMVQSTCASLGGTCDGEQDWFMSQGQSIVFNPESTGTAVVTAVMEQTIGFDPGPTTTKVSLAYEIFTICIDVWASSSQSLNSLESSSTPQPGVTNSQGSSPTSTSALSSHHSLVSSGAIAGIAIGMCVVAPCLMLALLCYLKRRKRRLVSTRVDPFTGMFVQYFCYRSSVVSQRLTLSRLDHRHLRAKSLLESRTSTPTSSYESSAGRSGFGDRSVLWIRAHAQTQLDGE